MAAPRARRRIVYFAPVGAWIETVKHIELKELQQANG